MTRVRKVLLRYILFRVTMVLYIYANTRISLAPIKEPTLNQMIQTQYDEKVVIYTSYMYIYIFSIPFIIFALLSLSLHSRNSDPGSQSRLFSPLPTTVRAFIFIARRVQHFLPSSTRVEFCLPTLLSALGNNWCLSRKKPCVLAPAGVWTHNSNLSSIRGYTLNHRGRPAACTANKKYGKYIDRAALRVTPSIIMLRECQRGF